MIKIKKYLLFLFASFFLLACENADSAYDRGYSDGYAVGFNSICYPNTSNMIYGDFDNQSYSAGYYDGKSDGENDCKRSR